MIHRGTQSLETERLLLRRFTLRDAEAMYQNWAGDDEVTGFLTWKTHEDVGTTKNVLTEWEKCYQNNRFYQWAVVPKGEEAPIGAVCAAWMNEEIGMIHTAYCIGKAWWGRGIVTEAYKELIRFFFEQVGAERIEAWHAPQNPGSGKVMQKCGMKYEGTLRKAARCNLGVTDMCMYAILKEDYLNKDR